ncbi:MAG: hypothetical protein AAF193_04685 [Bacteroidota bacterium]
MSQESSEGHVMELVPFRFQVGLNAGGGFGMVVAEEQPSDLALVEFDNIVLKNAVGLQIGLSAQGTFYERNAILLEANFKYLPTKFEATKGIRTFDVFINQVSIDVPLRYRYVGKNIQPSIGLNTSIWMEELSGVSANQELVNFQGVLGIGSVFPFGEHTDVVCDLQFRFGLNNIAIANNEAESQWYSDLRRNEIMLIFHFL